MRARPVPPNAERRRRPRRGAGPLTKRRAESRNRSPLPSRGLVPPLKRPHARPHAMPAMRPARLENRRSARSAAASLFVSIPAPIWVCYLLTEAPHVAPPEASVVKRRKEEDIAGILEFEGRSSQDPEFLEWLADHKARNG